MKDEAVVVPAALSAARAKGRFTGLALRWPGLLLNLNSLVARRTFPKHASERSLDARPNPSLAKRAQWSAVRAGEHEARVAVRPFPKLRHDLGQLRQLPEGNLSALAALRLISLEANHVPPSVDVFPREP